MPNHVTTVLTVCDLGGILIADVHAALLNDDRKVDFNVIDPAPHCLKGFEPNMGVIGRAKLALGLIEEPNQSLADLSDFTARLQFSNAMRDATTPIENGQIEAVCRAISNYRKCGYLYWYDWNNDHWGTKWNAYGQPDSGFSNDETDFQFETAWSHPFDLIAVLSKRLPQVRFSVKFADEDVGSNCGSYAITAGTRQDECIAPACSKQSDEEKTTFTKFAFELLYGEEDPAAHGYDKNWRYSDEVYEAHHA